VGGFVTSQRELFEGGEEGQVGTGIIIWKWEVGNLKYLEMYKQRENRDWLRNAPAINNQCCYSTQNMVALWLEKEGNGMGNKQSHMQKENCSLGDMTQ
jgi:hypothetical protein